MWLKWLFTEVVFFLFQRVKIRMLTSKNIRSIKMYEVQKYILGGIMMINRRERKKELTKEIIIDSALALFKEKGF